MKTENILKDIEKEKGKISKWGKKKISEKDYLTAIIIISSIAILFFVYINFMPKTLFRTSAEFIELTGCDNCFDVKSLTESIIENNFDINIKKQTFDYNSEQAESLIKKYNIEKVPALIILSKDLDKINLVDKQTFLTGNNYAIFDKAVPYVDLNSGKVEGLVNLKEVYDSECKDCASLYETQKQLEAIGIKVGNYEAVNSNSESGKTLIKENNLNFLPSLFISKEISEYWWIFEQIRGSFIEKQDYYVLKNPVLPYEDLITGEVKGIVNITYITDNSCNDCFNVTLLKSSFQNLGIFIENEKSIDISSSEGKNLMNKYNITAVPTVIMSEGIYDYGSFKAVLEQVGTFESDIFIFRDLDKLNVKYNKLR